MAAAAALSPPIAALLNDCQKSLANHAKTSKALFEIEKRDSKNFTTQFIAAIDRALVVPGKEPAVERFIKFIIQYSCAPGRNVLDRLLRHLITASKVEDKAVRHRSCQIICGILIQLAANNAQLDESLLDLVKEALVLRSKDKYSSVRAEAATGLSVFQDTKIADDIYDQFVRLLDDQQKEVRSAALGTIVLSRVTLAQVMRRARDSEESIRVDTFKITERGIPFQRLSVEQRVDLVKNGLTDSSEKVRAACLAMVKNAWLPAVKGSVETLLASMEVEEYEECAEMLLRALLDDAKDVAAFGEKETITAEEAIYWRIFSELIKTKPAESRIDLEDLLPGMKQMKILLQKNIRTEFICRQLLLTCAQSDPGADELGCRELCEMLEKWIYSVHLTEETRVLTCRALAALTDTDKYKRFLVAAINEFSTEPIDTITETKASSLDSPGWAQAITLVEELFVSSKELPAGLVIEIMKNILLPLVLLQDASIRLRGMKCLGLGCTLCEKAVGLYVDILVKAVQHDMVAVRQTAMKALFDIIMIWGSKVVTAASPEALECLSNNLAPTAQDALRRIAVEGFVKLLVSDTVRDDKILAQLFVLHFELRDERPSLVKSCLQTFFETYARWSHRNQSLITKAFQSTIRSILRAAPSSKLKKVKPLEVTTFIAGLTNPSLIEKKSKSPLKNTSYHNQLALTIATEVHTNQRSGDIEDMLKALPTLQLSKQDTAPLITMAGIVKSLQSRNLSEAVKKAINKVVTQLKEFGVELPEQATPEPTNPRPVDKKRSLSLASVVSKSEQDHLASLDAYEFEEIQQPAPKRITPGQRPCGNCKKALAAWFCAQCVALWCNGCLDTHHSAPIFKKHSVTPQPTSPTRSPTMTAAAAPSSSSKKLPIMESNSPELMWKPVPSKARSPAALPTPEPKKVRLDFTKVQPPAVAATPTSASKPTSKVAPLSKAAPRPHQQQVQQQKYGGASAKRRLELEFSDEEAVDDEYPPALPHDEDDLQVVQQKQQPLMTATKKRAPPPKQATQHSPPPPDLEDSPPPQPRYTSKRPALSSPVPPPAAAAPTKRPSPVTSTPSSKHSRTTVSSSELPANQICVAFSGIENPSELCKQVDKLGGKARDEKANAPLSLKATHLIVDDVSQRRLKTVIAAVLGMWIVSSSWIRDSAVAGHFLPAKDYGRKFGTKHTIAGKRVYISAGFRADRRYQESDWKILLCRVGEATIVDDPAEADYALVANGERVAGVNYEALMFTWAAFMELLQPSIDL